MKTSKGARELVSQLVIREGTSTSELRSQVLAALQTKDAEVAERHERTRCCRANSSSEVGKDVVWETRRVTCAEEHSVAEVM